MDDMNTFERQVARDALRDAGPSLPVDAAAVFARAVTAPSPKWRFQTMFSAAKFLVAGVIVALFGGFLLAGVLTQPSDESVPAATPDGPGTFSPAGSLPEPRFGHTATRLRDGRILVVGGEKVGEDPADSGDQAFADALVWDPETEMFSSAGSLAQPRTAHTATLLHDGRVLVIGGYDYGDCDGYCLDQIAGAEVWDPDTGSFQPAGSLADGRPDHSAVLLDDGHVLVVGGRTGDGARFQTFSEVWDPDSETFSPADALQVERIIPDATLLSDGRVLVVGGEDGSGGMRTSAEIWDPQTSSFSLVGSFDYRHEDGAYVGFSVTRLPDGAILIVGGTYDTDPSDERDAFELVTAAMLWDPEAGESRPAGQLAEARAFHSATLLPDGRVLVVGGGSPPGPGTITSAELWDPVTASFTPAGALVEPRWGNTTTLLDDGRVLVLGGITPGGKMLASAEVWVPGAQQPAMEDEADTATPDLLSGVDLVTEEVEPGVYRVLSDGVDDLSDIPDLEVPATMASGGECWAFLVGGECWANAYGMLVREVDGELPIEQVPDAEHGLTFPAQEVIGPLPGSGDTGWLIITGPTGFQGLLGYGPQGWTRVPYAAGEDGRVLSIDPGSACGVVLGPDRYPGLVGPDGTAWVYTLEREGLRVTGWDGDSWSSFGPVDIGTPDVEDPCLLLDAAFGPNGTMWFTTRRIPLYVITPEAVAGTE